MGSLCLSSASILRCYSLTRIQNIYLIIPTALEVIFSISLVFIDRGSGKRNMLLTAEGLSFLTLALLELLAQILPAVRGSLPIFKAFDLAIGITSFLPISLYTIFLYLLTNAEIVSALPRRIKSIAKLALVLFIPAIITFNEIASFIGVSTRNIPVGKGTETVVATGFPDSAQQGLWTFFTSLTLALLTGFQAAVFCLAFFRLTQAILDQRRIESQRNDKVHLIKGIGWVTGSLQLGAVETLVGFAGGEFGVAITRRTLRLLARATLCIGVVKGVDLVEDFRAMRNDPGVSKFRRSQMHNFISNPRLSTFRQLSPKATTFHTAQRGSYMYGKFDSPTSLTTTGLPGMAHFANVKAKNGRQRVTVQYDRGTPSLHMRFSTLNLPSPATIVEEIKSQPQADWSAHPFRPRSSFHHKSVFRDSADSVPSFSGPFELVTTPRRMLSQRSARAQLYHQAATSGESPPPDAVTTVEPQPRDPGRVQSMRSIPDSLQAVRDLADKFPGPPMAYKDRNTFIKPSVWEEVPIEAQPMPQALGSPSEFIFEEPPRKGMIVLSDDESGWSSSSPIAFFDNRNTPTSRQPTLYTVGTPLRSAHRYFEKPIDPFNDDEDDARSPYTADEKTPGGTVPRFRQVSLQDSDVIDLETALDFAQSRPQKLQSPQQQSFHKSDEKIARTAEWIGSRSKATKHLQVDTPTKLLQHSGERDMSNRDIPFSRVKSIGKVPRKSTPLPMHASANRGSMHLRPIVIPPRGGNMPVIVDEYEYGSLESTTNGGGMLKDSEVLGTDNIDARRHSYF